MEDKCGVGSVLDRFCMVPRSDSKEMVGRKRDSVEVGEKSELGHKRVKMRDLESVFRSEGKIGRDTLQRAIDSPHKQIDLNVKACETNDLTGDDTNRLSSLEKFATECDVHHIKSRGFGLELNPKDISSLHNNDPFYPYKNCENLKSRVDSECGSSIGPLEEKDPMRIWKEMKQNGFFSSSHGVIPMPKSRGRKNKNDGFKKKMELAKKEQVDRFAKIAAPSGLLNELNPGIINHVRNSKQVHSIIEALVKSEELENRSAKNKQVVQTKSGKEEFSNRKSDPEKFNGLGLNRFTLHEEGYNILSESKQMDGCYPVSMKKSVSSAITRWDGKSTRSSHSKFDSEDNILALKLSSTIASEITSSLSNEDSTNLIDGTSLSVKAAYQWLELLHQDFKGRLAALRRSKKRVRAVIHTELPRLMLREFSSNQENDPYVNKHSATGFSGGATADSHQVRWSALFDQMDKTLSEEEKHLESWLNNVKEMQLHCERGLFQYNAAYGLQQLGALKNDCRLQKAGNSEGDMAVRAAAASIYSTSNFLSSIQNLPSF